MLWSWRTGFFSTAPWRIRYLKKELSPEDLRLMVLAVFLSSLNVTSHERIWKWVMNLISSKENSVAMKSLNWMRSFLYARTVLGEYLFSKRRYCRKSVILCSSILIQNPDSKYTNLLSGVQDI